MWMNKIKGKKTFSFEGIQLCCEDKLFRRFAF